MTWLPLENRNSDQKSMYWHDESLSPTSARSESGCSSITSSSNSSVISDDVTAYHPRASLVSGSVFTTAIYLNHHKKLNRSQSDSKARYNNRNAGNNASSKYKTELCNTFMENNGDCKYKDKCQFAHGLHELRKVDRHPKYKTVLCKKYPDDICPYGQRCHFIHEDKNSKVVPDATPPLAMSPGNDLMLSLRDLSWTPSSMGSLSPASSLNAFMFDSSASSPFQSPPPSPIERRLPIFSEISGPRPMLPFSTHFGGLTA